MWSNRSLPVLLLLGYLALLATGCTAESEEPPKLARVVDTYVVQPANGLSITTFSGRIQAAEKTSLSFEISGKIERMAVEVGDRFTAGDILAELDEARYQLIVNQRRAEENEARAQRQEKRQDYTRQASLREKGFVSQAHLDAAKAALDTAESQFASAVAARELAERDLRMTTLRAPFDGSVSQRHVEPSERVGANQPVVEVISERDGFEMHTSVPETLVSAIPPGSTHRVIVPALSEASIPATIRHLGTQPQSSNNYPVVLTLDEAPPGLRSGMTAQVELSIHKPQATGAQASQWHIPLTALVYDTKGSAHVLRVTDAMRLERVAVEVASVDDGVAAIRGELASGERIVARGAEFVSEGETVSLLGQGPERYN
ncbi:hemolysin D [Litchfieldella qijiaojingensis]|uniref:Hemolysin D n=1 Tax=Litchfieldella qijiaojingensis TaxID=980347 RepID=A0ABQ2YWS7_9GAMM|nr:efflux RND transporter periplasmic adaptor subunit [Halomonas qijiaojingensis]GGX94578.1 hemolysin D [Halomonas qijiaojingensis]